MAAPLWAEVDRADHRRMCVGRIGKMGRVGESTEFFFCYLLPFCFVQTREGDALGLLGIICCVQSSQRADDPFLLFRPCLFVSLCVLFFASRQLRHQLPLQPRPEIDIVDDNDDNPASVICFRRLPTRFIILPWCEQSCVVVQIHRGRHVVVGAKDARGVCGFRKWTSLSLLCSQP